jgi:hypothetical protein
MYKHDSDGVPDASDTAFENLVFQTPPVPLAIRFEVARV